MPDKEVEKEAIRKLYEHGIIFCNCASNEGDENKFSNTKRTWQFDEEVICVSAYMHSTMVSLVEVVSTTEKQLMFWAVGVIVQQWLTILMLFTLGVEHHQQHQ